MIHGLKGDKDILVAAISSIQFKKAGALTNGYIQFTFAGGDEARRGILEATRDENTVMFHLAQEEDFARVRELVQLRMAELRSPAAGSNPTSGLDELDKLAILRERGIVTEEEFQAKKRQLLGI